MTTAELITRVSELTAYDLDTTLGTAPTDAQVVDALNRRLRAISVKLCIFDPKIEFTMTAGTETYDLRDTVVFSRKIVQPRDVIINGNMLFTARGTRYGLWTVQELDKISPTWRTLGSGVPYRACWAPPTTLFVNPKPTQAVIDAGNNYVSGQVLAADLDANDTDAEPELPEETHMALAMLTACDVAKPYATEVSQINRLVAMTQDATQTIEDAAKASRRAIQGVGTYSGRADFMRV